jgi:squalene-hopene/tetraprenyl-beta-curcumene cyclase
MTGRFLKTFAVPCAASALVLIAVAANAADKPAASAASGWDAPAAERYLDSREVWWQSWDRSQKDHRTMCVSCHTQGSYGLARPGLSQQLGEQTPSAAEQVMLASIQKRVMNWTQMQPVYSDVLSGAGKEVESRNTESVLNAVILSSYDAPTGHMSPTTHTAFDNAWALQSPSGPDTGSWVWQNFHFAPWESNESQYHWAALMAMAVGKAPDHYRDDPKIAGNLAALTSYLQSHYAAQPLLNQIVALWASESFPAVVGTAERAKLVDTLTRLQHADGGWSTTDLGPWKRVDNTPLETRSDGYATALIVLVMEETGARTNPHVARGIAWLLANQNKETGAWTAWSLNKDRDPKSDPGPFMSDAATSYAVMALEARR